LIFDIGSAQIPMFKLFNLNDIILYRLSLSTAECSFMTFFPTTYCHIPSSPSSRRAQHPHLAAPSEPRRITSATMATEAELRAQIARMQAELAAVKRAKNSGIHYSILTAIVVY
jgi:hypothetical protein